MKQVRMPNESKLFLLVLHKKKSDKKLRLRHC